MTTEPTAKHQQEAREIVEGVFRPRGSSPIYATAGRLFDELETEFAAALSSRDREIREVLEGLRLDECWCTKIDGHTPACLSTRVLWNKVQG